MLLQETTAAPLTTTGWVFMIASLAFVVGLTAWCYARVLRLPPETVEKTKDFHSA